MLKPEEGLKNGTCFGLGGIEVWEGKVKHGAEGQNGIDSHWVPP